MFWCLFQWNKNGITTTSTKFSHLSSSTHMNININVKSTHLYFKCEAPAHFVRAEAIKRSGFYDISIFIVRSTTYLHHHPEKTYSRFREQLFSRKLSRIAMELSLLLCYEISMVVLTINYCHRILSTSPDGYNFQCEFAYYGVP